MDHLETARPNLWLTQDRTYYNLKCQTLGLKKIRLWDKTKHPNHCSALLDHSFSFQDENPLQQEWTVEPSFAWTFIWDSLPMPCRNNTHLNHRFPAVCSCACVPVCSSMWELFQWTNQRLAYMRENYLSALFPSALFEKSYWNRPYMYVYFHSI